MKTSNSKDKTIISDIKRGSLKMLDFEIMDNALKIALMKRLAHHNDAAWKLSQNSQLLITATFLS